MQQNDSLADGAGVDALRHPGEPAEGEANAAGQSKTANAHTRQPRQQLRSRSLSLSLALPSCCSCKCCTIWAAASVAPSCCSCNGCCMGVGMQVKENLNPVRTMGVLVRNRVFFLLTT